LSKKKSDYAIVLSCNPGYGFGMMATMNAQKYFGTDADWEIAYEIYTDEERKAISDAFPFNVNWTPVSELMKEVNDRRTDNTGALEKMWLAYWLMALKVLKEKKYKAVCVIQADTFVFVNLDVYFKIAEAGILACSEYAFTWKNAEDLPCGDDKTVWDRYMAGVFDSVNFIGPQYIDLISDIIEFQCVNSFKGESSHSVIALNRAVAKHGHKDKVLRLDRRLWAGDCIWGDTVLRIVNDRVYNSDNIQLSAWHCRWWQEGRVKSEWHAIRHGIQIGNKVTPGMIQTWDRADANYNFVKSFMERFNNMTPEVASPNHAKGFMVRPRYELGEGL